METVNQLREKFCRIMAVNEALFGQEENRVASMMSQTAIVLTVPLDSPICLCLTGLEKRFYMERLGMSRQDFLAMIGALERELDGYFTSIGCPWEWQVVQYDQSKRLCCRFSAQAAGATPASIADFLHEAMQRQYHALPPFAASGLCNLTALVEGVAGFCDLAPAFEQARSISQAGFFLMESQVLTPAQLEALRQPCTMGEMLELVDRVERAVDHGDVARLEEAMTLLFLERLRWSFDGGRVKDVLSELRKKLLRYSETFQLALEEGIDGLYLKKFATIGELCAYALALLRRCAHAEANHGRGIGPLAREAIYYMRGNYSREMGLEDVAAHIGVSGGYLSRVFNRELGESLPAYLTRLRMSRAVVLLESSELGAGEIGRQVGIGNPQYFGAVFKKQFGVSPQEYRRDYRGALPSNEEG